MKKELEQRFYDRWPEWFRGRHEGMQSNLMCFGFDHNDGWFDLEWRLCEDLEEVLGDNKDYKLMQVKEKFGLLRWYDNGNCGEHWEAVANRVRQAVKESAQTCERCGSQGKLDTKRAWWQTLCEACKDANPPSR